MICALVPSFEGLGVGGLLLRTAPGRVYGHKRFFGIGIGMPYGPILWFIWSVRTLVLC